MEKWAIVVHACQMENIKHFSKLTLKQTAKVYVESTKYVCNETPEQSVCVDVFGRMREWVSEWVCFKIE